MSSARFRDSTEFRGGMLVVIAAVAFSLSLVIARISYDSGTNALTVMSLRLVLFAATMSIWFRWQGRTLRVPMRSLLASYAVGIVFYIGIASYLASVAYLPVSLAVLIFYTYPIMIVVIVALLERRAPKLVEIAAIAAAFTGLMLALGISFEGLNPIGLGLAALGALGSALNIVGSSLMMKTLPTSQVTLHMAVGAMIVACATTLATGSFALPSENAVGWTAMGIMLVTFIIAFLSMFNGIRMIGPVRASVMMNLEPLATILLAAIILGERVSAQQLLGAVLVITGITLAQLRLGREL